MRWTTKLVSTGLCQASWDRRTTTSSYKLKVHPGKKTDQRKTFQINHTSRVHKQHETLQTFCRRKNSILLTAYLPYETCACCFTAWGCQTGTTFILSLEQSLCHHPNPGISLLITGLKLIQANHGDFTCLFFVLKQLYLLSSILIAVSKYKPACNYKFPLNWLISKLFSKLDQILKGLDMARTKKLLYENQLPSICKDTLCSN